MADRVRFILDGLAPLFKSFIAFELFNEAEVQSIVKKTTDFEYLLRRPALTESDFNTYITYYVNLNSLLHIRCDKTTKIKRVDKKLSIKDINSIKNKMNYHIIYIYDRSIRKFPNYLKFWYSYIDYLLLDINNNKVSLNELYGKLLIVHSKNENVWIKAANYEIFYNHNSESARVLLQRSIRHNPLSQKIWLFYYKFELWYASKIIDRKKALNLDIDSLNIITIPFIVFINALTNINELNFALQFYDLSLKISSLLSNKVKQKLYELYSNQLDLWIYDIKSQFLLIPTKHGQDSDIDNNNTDSKIENFENFIIILNNCITIYNQSYNSLNELDYINLTIEFLNFINIKIINCINVMTLSKEGIDEIIIIIKKLLEIISSLYNKYVNNYSYITFICLLNEFRLGLIFINLSKESLIDQPIFKSISIPTNSIFPIKITDIIIYIQEHLSKLESNKLPINEKLIFHLTNLIKEFTNYLSITDSKHDQLIESIYLKYIQLYKSLVIYDYSSNYLIEIIHQLSTNSNNYHSEINKLFISILSQDNYNTFDCNTYIIKYFEFSLIYVDKDLLLGNDIYALLKSQVGQFRSSYLFIQKIMKSKPFLMINIDLPKVYIKALEIEDYFLAINQNLIGKDRFSFHVKILDEAINHCPDNELFWNRYIDIETELGQLKKANHLRWKKENLLLVK